MTYKFNALPLSYIGNNQSASSNSENLLGRHIWSMVKIAKQNKPQESEKPLYNGRKITVINFSTIN